MKKYLLILACVPFLLSCNEEKKNEKEESTQMEHVMAIHDEVMPKMGKLGSLVGKLKPMADSLGAESPEAKTMRELQRANESMMDWMKGFGDRFDSEEILEGKALTPEKQKWLNEEEEKVKAVKEQINTSIEKAEKLLAD
ncbi:hypothetical protein BFP77_03715 [Maribacter sp. 4U21]|uniref:hypothetical protein n=1 Tax=Maribacter sp. 4U21 TaxID=1889779 RepID=UPI000C147525|nr:hypothetical protein [Maribacter sp. 4U21]PIB30894.1 hypothetical protein BFP77_03715 [Maribacter sp. 4U21]